ncbi:ABC transporter permease [Nocardioides malaquae]|uniref:ABC transporter permease n=1 Tax=Nocardioides malaquae TaxID=2773426 RepID=UPI001D0D1806|nr:ABC transporter permease [Nocardioides malaquae]
MSGHIRAALRVELRKVTSTPLWWILAGGAFLYLAFMGAVMAFGVSVPVEEGGLAAEGLSSEAMTMSIYGLPASMGYVFPLVLGALAITGEYRHGTLTQSLLVDPSRSRLLLAKIAVQAGFGAVLGLCSVAGVTLAGAGVSLLTDTPTYLDTLKAWETLGLTVLALALWGMVGVGFGALVPNQVASIVIILAFTQLLEPLLRLGLAALGDVASQVSLYLPGAAAEALVGASIYTAIGGADLLSRWAGGLVLLAYAVAFALLGRVTTLRRDVA